jgi:hypothetical protein
LLCLEYCTTGYPFVCDFAGSEHITGFLQSDVMYWAVSSRCGESQLNHRLKSNLQRAYPHNQSNNFMFDFSSSQTPKTSINSYKSLRYSMASWPLYELTIQIDLTLLGNNYEYVDPFDNIEGPASKRPVKKGMW